MKKLKKVFFGNIQKQYGTISNLIEIQLDTFNWFLQPDTAPDKRLNQGLQSVFNHVFPISSPDNTLEVVPSSLNQYNPSGKVCHLPHTVSSCNCFLNKARSF